MDPALILNSQYPEASSARRIGTMSRYVVIECSLCGEARPYGAEETTREELLDGITAHVLHDHPGTPPERAEEVLERAVTGAEPVEDPGLEPRGWDRYDRDR